MSENRVSHKARAITARVDVIRNIRHSVFLFLCVIMVLLPTFASAEATRKADVILTAPGDAILSVDGIFITQKNLNDAVNERVLKSYGLNDDHQIRLLILKNIILQILAEKLISSKEVSADPPLARRLENSRRDILLQAYLDKHVSAPPPTKPEVEKFIAEHPELFGERRNYHYAELAIETKTPATLQATRDRIRLLEEYNSPSLETMQAVEQWLEQNNIRHGYLRTWKTTEALSDAVRTTIMRLAKGTKKISVENNGSVFRILVVFGDYPDPIDPLFAKGSVFSNLWHDAKEKQAQSVVANMLARGKIVLYDQSFKDLNVPKSNGDITSEAVTTPLGSQLLIAWYFSTLVFLPMALWLFFRERHPPQDGEMPSITTVLSYHLPFRVGFVLLIGTILLFIIGHELRDYYESVSQGIFIRLAMLGSIAALGVVFLISRTPPLRSWFSSRWEAISIVCFVQIATVVVDSFLREF